MWFLTVILASVFMPCIVAAPGAVVPKKLDVPLPIRAKLLSQGSPSKVHPFVINGTAVNPPGKYPWQVSLQWYGRHICGGSIISDRHVITAAHCVDGEIPSLLSVMVGLHDVVNSTGTAVRHAVQQIFAHEDYNFGLGAFPNDIALLLLATPIQFDDHSAPIPLDLDSTHGTTSQCVISGWGVINTDPYATADVLQEAATRIIKNWQCRGYWASSINPGHVCVFTGHNSACMGDSGGPLHCQTPGSSWQLVGLTSWGSGSCVAGLPSVYTRISSFKDWIAETSELEF